jgi:Zn-dependent protease
MQGLDSLFYIAILLVSVILHEVAHGYAAFLMGDKTAFYAGRLTANPLKHLDWFGSVLLPGILLLTHSPFMFGWARPVPYNPYNFTNRRQGTMIVASAGIIANLFLATFFGLSIRFFAPTLGHAATTFIASIVLVNCVLAVFNILPVPPLDGSKILFALLPARYERYLPAFERFGFAILLLVLFFLWQYISPVVGQLFALITGSQLY